MYWIKKFFSDPESHGRSFIEVSVVAAFSLLFVSLPGFRDLGANENISNIEFFTIAQILALTYAQYGSIFWLAFIRGDKPRHSPRAALGLVATLLIIPIVPYLSFDPQFQSVTAEGAKTVSFALYSVYLIINYLLLFYLNVEPPSPEKSLSKGASSLREKYEEKTHARD